MIVCKNCEKKHKVGKGLYHYNYTFCKDCKKIFKAKQKQREKLWKTMQHVDDGSQQQNANWIELDKLCDELFSYEKWCNYSKSFK